MIEPSEDQLQVYAADVIRAFRVPGVVAWHTPNGGHRSPSVAKQLKSFGVLPGVADWTFMSHGPRVAFLELKRRMGVQSKAQKEFQAAATALGAPYIIARTLEEIDDALIALGVINKVSNRTRSGSGGRSGEALGVECLPVSKKAA